jgi:hypothetical protein
MKSGISPLYKGGLRGVVTVRVSDNCVYTVANSERRGEEKLLKSLSQVPLVGGHGGWERDLG